MNMEHDRLQRMTAKTMQQGQTDLKVILVTQAEQTFAALQTALAPMQGVTVEKLPSFGKLQTALAKSNGQPTLLAVDMNPDRPDDLGLIGELRKIADGERVAVVALIDRASDFGALRAIRAGASDVLLKPFDLEEMREVFSRVLQSSRAQARIPVTHGKAIAFMHLSGGVGATTLAVNSACTLARRRGSPGTCLLDLDIQFGNAASLLDLSVVSPIEDLIDDPKRLDARMLDSMMPRHASGVRILTAPRTLLPSHAYGIEAVTTLIDTAKREFDFVVLDLPVALAGWTDAVLRSASVIYLVTSLTVPSAHRLIKFLELLREEGITQLPLRIVVNRHHSGPARGHDISLSQFEKATGRKPDHLIPNDYSLISLSHGQGKPAVLVRPKSAFSQSLTKMLSAEFGERPSDAPRRRWFSFGRS